MALTVGVLALQGAFVEHIHLLKKCAEQDSTSEWDFIEVRTPQELARCDGLVLPGGESTTMSLVAARSNLLEPLRDFVKYVLIDPFRTGNWPDLMWTMQSTPQADMGHLRRIDIARRVGKSYQEGRPRTHWGS